MADIIKQDEEELNTQLNLMHTFLNTPAKVALLSLPSTDVDAFNILWTTWSTTYPAHKAHIAAGAAITAGKDAAKNPLVAKFRAFAKVFRARRELGNVTDQQLLEAGIPALGQSTTSQATPDTNPVITIDASQRQRHELNWRDEATPGKTARPASARTCEIRGIVLAAGAMPPDDPETWPYKAEDPKTPHLITYEVEDLGKEGWVVARWLGYNGEAGQWSAVVHSTILR